jgi:hypothetical protein
VNRRTSAALLLSLAGAFAAPVPVQALDLPVQGNGRGGPFRAECQNGFMVGFTGRVGAWIDNLRPICATWNGQQLVDRVPHPVQAGVSRGGGPSSASCPSFIGQIVLYDTKGDGPTNVMHHIDFQCFSPTGVDEGWRQYGSTTVPEGRGGGGTPPFARFGVAPDRFVSPCPWPQVAVGLHGRSGTFVDALGLICQPRPAVAAPPPPPAPPPSTKRGPLGKRSTTTTNTPAPTQPAQKIATAKNDVDVYNSPVQPRRVVAIMRRGVTGVVVGYHRDGWCQLDISAPDVVGWVAQNHLNGCP